MSPIKGISDRVLLPRLGKIRLGIKRETSFGTFLPEATDYFVCPDEVRKVLGDKPRELRVMFPSEDQEQWASQYLRRYSDSLELLCRGDGRRAITYAGSKAQGARQAGGTSFLRETACDRLSCEHYLRAECRKVMNLQFLLPDCPGFGVYQVDTGCIYSIRNVNAALLFTRAIVSRVSMIPMSLKLVEREIHLQGWPESIYVLTLTWEHSLSDLQKFAATPPSRSLLVPPPDSEAPDDMDAPVELLPAPRKRRGRQEESRLDQWARAKSKILRYEIREDQLAKWFESNYGIKVRLMDFESAVPPDKLTSSMLSFFCDYVDLICSGQ